jgi:hypothetical protein
MLASRRVGASIECDISNIELHRVCLFSSCTAVTAIEAQETFNLAIFPFLVPLCVLRNVRFMPILTALNYGLIPAKRAWSQSGMAFNFYYQFDHGIPQIIPGKVGLLSRQFNT